jgi:excisionase family DNA binding protein
MSETLTTKEVAEMLGVSTARVRQLVLSGQLPAEKFGRDLVIKGSDLQLVANRPIGRPSTKQATQPANGTNAALTASAKAKKRGKK